MLGLSNGLKNLTTNAAKFAADKTAAGANKLAGAAKNKLTSESFGMDVGTSMLLEDEGDLTPDEAADISSKSDEDAAEGLAENPGKIKKFTAAVNSKLNWLSDNADVIKQTLFYIKDGVSPFSRDSIYNKKVKAGLDAYMSKVEGLKKTKKVNESDIYSNPVVGSLIATLFEDDVADSPSAEPDVADSPSAEPDDSTSSETSSDEESPTKIASKTPAEELLKFFTDQKYSKDSWEKALDHFEKTEATDKEFKIKGLHLTYTVTKNETKKDADGKEQTTPVSEKKEITTFKEFSDCVKGLLDRDDKVKAVTEWIGSNKENLVGPKAQRLVDRIRLLADAIGKEETDEKLETDLYVYCNPYIKDKSEDAE